MCHIQMPSFPASLENAIFFYTLSTCLPPPCSLAASISHVTLTAKNEFKTSPLEVKLREAKCQAQRARTCSEMWWFLKPDRRTRRCLRHFSKALKTNVFGSCSSREKFNNRI